MRTGVIYKATNKINGKSYIGQTVNYNTRKRQHRHDDGTVFYKAIKKYGWENFVWSILESNIPRDKLNERESYWISFYDTYNHGYNSTTGGQYSGGLEKLQKDNPDLIMANVKKARAGFDEWRKQHPEEFQSMCYKNISKAIDATKKKCKCIELNIVFDSLTDAERWSMTSKNPNGKKCSHQHIAHVCRGQRPTCGGYHWMYI